METATKFFFELTPERVLDAVESVGLRGTGRCMALNSFENRVYDIELEKDVENFEKTGIRNNCIAKFYRPNRWTEEQIREEHIFLQNLKDTEIPVVCPIPFPGGDTLKKTPHGDIWYTLYPKVGGRAPEEFTDEQLQRVGRLLARIHAVGKVRPAPHRLKLDDETFGIKNLNYLLQNNIIPDSYRARYENSVAKICEQSKPWFQKASFQRIHGDCHLGNLLYNQNGYFFLDFDDMVQGPPVQDIWLLVPGRDTESLRQRQVLIEAYEQMFTFDRTSLKLVEVLRALRIVHFSAWIARRWEDPAFPHAFPHFGSDKYWREETQALEEQVGLIA
jgi:Ser/Thr protein kinase RdoA (MazF antagonist)